MVSQKIRAEILLLSFSRIPILDTTVPRGKYVFFPRYFYSNASGCFFGLQVCPCIGQNHLGNGKGAKHNPVVDDNTDIRELLVDQLQVQGYVVVTAGDGLGVVE